MSVDTGSLEDENIVQEIFSENGIEEESFESSLSNWSSVEFISRFSEHEKGGRDFCADELQFSNTTISNHPYYKYLAVPCPGIEHALLKPMPVIRLDDVALYHAICEETNTCPIGLVYRNLLNKLIDLSYYCVNSLQVRAMALALENNQHVQQLNLTENFLKDDACYHLGKMLKTNNTLEVLNLTSCRIGASGLKQLIYKLHKNRAMRDLNLSRNEIGDEGLLILTNEMDYGIELQRLNLSKNKLSDIGAYALSETLDCINILTHLDLSWNNFVNLPSIARLIKILGNSEVLQELNLSWNGLEGTAVAKSIKQVLLVPSLRVLILSNNRFNKDAVVIIAENLTEPKRLNTLDLSCNPIGPPGANILIQKMKERKVKLKNLILESICVDKAFIENLERVRRLKFRKNFKVIHDVVVSNWTLQGTDMRELTLRRAECLGNMAEVKVDVPMYLLKLSTQYSKPVDANQFIERLLADKVPLDDDLVLELCDAFPGPIKKEKTIYINLQDVQRYICRLWPDKTLLNDSDNLVTTQSHTKRKRKGKK